ncbi:MAG: hypothetical protein IH897_11110 [Planctomycetes bacterium]|nr:hypothetical protein [Planctomycetota bacterium]
MSRSLSGAASLCTLLISSIFPCAVRGADHGDTPFLVDAQRHDARLTDLYAFVRGEKLVVIVALDPTIPPEVNEYLFASDLTVTIFIDHDSSVTFDDPVDLSTYGGSLVAPQNVEEDIALTVRFDEQGSPILETVGLPPGAGQNVRLFAGLRDDPFIRGPRIGRNVAAIVLQIPLSTVLNGQDTLLIWTIAKVEGMQGPFQEMAGRAFRSQFPENNAMNTLHPRDHFNILGVRPDVIIFNTSRLSAFPNGRELTDDVLDLVGDPRPLSNDDPFPDANDREFLDEFPYLSPPHIAGQPAVPAVSEFALIVMTLLGLTAGTLLFGRRRPVVADVEIDPV